MAGCRLLLAMFLISYVGEAFGVPLRPTTTIRRDATLCPSYPLPTASAFVLQAKLEPFLEEAAKNISAVLEEDKSPGGAVVSIVYNDTVIWTKGFGLINNSEPRRGAPDGNTAFRIGSITKVFTALMTLMLRDSSMLRSIDENVTDYLPQFSIKNRFQTQRGITFRQLMSHMAGLPRNPPCEGLFVTGCNLTDNQIYANLAQMQLMYPPGEQPAYSNLGFGLLGRVLEKITQSKWEDAVRLMVFNALGMNNSGNSFTPESVKQLAVGYYPDGKEADLINIGWDAPAGQMYSSSNDLGRLMQLVFRTEFTYNLDKGQILDGETLREWMEPAYKYTDGTGFGYPWELIPLGDFTLRTKDGAINGYNAEFQMAHEIKTGFIFLQSCDSCSSHPKIISIAQQIILEASTVLSTLQPGPPVPPQPEEYVGVYSTKTGATTNVTLKTIFGKPALYITQDYTGIIEWRGGDTFQISVQGMATPCHTLHSGYIGESVYFQRSGSAVVSLSVPGWEYGTVYQKQSTSGPTEWRSTV